MQIEQWQWTARDGWNNLLGEVLRQPPQLVLIFGSISKLEEPGFLDFALARYPAAELVGCSTAGEIAGASVSEFGAVMTAIHFDSTTVRVASMRVDNVRASRETGKKLGESLPLPGLVHVLALSEGLNVNGSELVAGITEGLPAGVGLTGGLAGDDGAFQRTVVFRGKSIEPDSVAVIGFYGESIKVGYGSMGGFDGFGPDRIITRSDGKVLYELDGKPALELYKTYLGEHASQLPGSAMHFPLSIRLSEGKTPVVRTVLGVDEKAGSITFAGDVPEGAIARLMRANFNRLIEGAAGAAMKSGEMLANSSPDFALLITCVGRKIVLKQRTEEEIESVRGVLGSSTVFTGFYSYGEIAPFGAMTGCELHNQTMSITTFVET